MFASPSAHDDLGSNNWLNIDLSIKGGPLHWARSEGGVPTADRVTDCCLFLFVSVFTVVVAKPDGAADPEVTGSRCGLTTLLTRGSVRADGV